MPNKSPISFIMKFFIFLILFILLVSPIMSVIAPITFIGNMFNNTWGTVQEFYGFDYSGNFSEEIDVYIRQRRTSIDYKKLIACTFNDLQSNPSECLDMLDDTGSIYSANANQDLIDIDFAEYHGTYANSYFNKIHVLGKYTVELFEIVGKELVEEEYEENGEIQIRYVEKDVYDWVYYDEIRRGACENTDTQRCYIILEDKYVYPFQYVSSHIDKRYGVRTDYDDLINLKVIPNQVWSGNKIFAFSKGKVIESTSNVLKLQINANHIDLIVTYEGNITSKFHVGETVEATEHIANNKGGSFTLSTQNSKGEYINPSLFFDSAILPKLMVLDPDGWSYPFDSAKPVTARVGIYNPFGVAEQHNGVDFGADCGTPIYNVKSGTVIASGHDSSRGNYVTVRTDDGYMVFYFHLTSVYASNGQQLNAGDFVGSVGNTGKSTGCHLHLGVQNSGSYADFCDIVNCP